MAGTPARSAERLPRGRHGLSREEVVRSQRARLQRAMAEVMAEKGYVGTSVADVLRAARVSRETFYQQFSSKEDCFMSAYERGVESLVSGMSEAQPPDGRADRAFRIRDRGLPRGARRGTRVRAAVPPRGLCGRARGPEAPRPGPAAVRLPARGALRGPERDPALRVRGARRGDQLDGHRAPGRERRRGAARPARSAHRPGQERAGIRSLSAARASRAAAPGAWAK